MSAKNKKSYTFLIKPITFLIGIFLTVWLVLKIETIRPSDFGFYKDIFTREEIITKRNSYPLRKTKDTLTAFEREMATIAWKYFENNYQPQTGLVNSVNYFPSTTFWDISSSIMATTSAYEIGLIGEDVMNSRIHKLLQTLAAIKLHNDILPNKVYNTVTLEMTRYDNTPTNEGIGWSALDLGKFLTSCYRLVRKHPQFTHDVNILTQKWKFDEAVDNATMYGISFNYKDKRESKFQEGKLGYEEYCAKGFNNMGYDASNALRYDDFINFEKIYTQEIGTDSRHVEFHTGYNYVVSEPYILDGLEYGFDINSRELAYRVFLAQHERYRATGILTCVSETHLDKAPHFVYNSVFADGKSWVCISENGEDAENYKTFSTSAAIAWYYLLNHPYSLQLFKKAQNLNNPELGWYSGEYEKTGKPNQVITANVNAIVLEALNYKLKGPLLKN